MKCKTIKEFCIYFYTVIVLEFQSILVSATNATYKTECIYIYIFDYIQQEQKHKFSTMVKC